MSALGHEQTSRHVRAMSVIPSKRTFISAVCTSAWCHNTGASTHLAASLLSRFQSKVCCPRGHCAPGIHHRPQRAV